MAGLETATSDCCGTEQQTSCCEPSEKEACCAPEASTCGCSGTQTVERAQVREQVRERYAAAALALADSADAGCGCSVHLEDKHGRRVFGASLYEDEPTSKSTEQAVTASMGCGVPTVVADMREGETVLDLGSGAGADVLISARCVATTGKAIGLDMTEEMLELARRNAQEAGLQNVEFRRGYIEEIPLPDASVDVVISNCVLNLSGDKPRAMKEVARVLRAGGRFAISDVIADEDMDDETRADMRHWTGCIAGALTQSEFEGALADAGLVDIEIRETHRVHEHAAAAIVRARKPEPYARRPAWA
jgi:SAM-dependent methyltransferase